MKPISYALDGQGTIYIGNRVIARDNPENPHSAADIAGLVFRANIAADMLEALEAIIDTTGGLGGPFTMARAALAKAKGE